MCGIHRTTYSYFRGQIRQSSGSVGLLFSRQCIAGLPAVTLAVQACNLCSGVSAEMRVMLNLHQRAAVYHYSDAFTEPKSVTGIMNYMNPVHSFIRCLIKIHLNVILPFTSRSSKWSLAFGLSLHCSFTMMCATCSAHLILLHIISCTVQIMKVTGM
jgi:hypothetical protein